MRLSARIISVVLSFLLLVGVFSSVLTPFSQAQQTTLNANGYSLPDTDSNVPKNLHTLSQGLFIDALSTLTCQLGGVDFATKNHQCITYNTTTGKLTYAPQNAGVMGYVDGAIAALFIPPIHTKDYVQYMAENFGLVKHAYAASGFDQLNPLTKVWLVFRNTVYLFFVLIFVVIGFAIMIRAKIDPRTVMTIENQIPKLVIALVLVTFSFAIAGLVIDIMWVSIYFIINLFVSVDPTISGKTVFSALMSDPISVANSIGPNGAGGTLHLGGDGILGIAREAANSIHDAIYNVTAGILQSNGVAEIVKDVLSATQPLVLLTCTINGLNFIPPSFDNAKVLNCVGNGLTSEIAIIGAAIAFLVFLFAMFAALLRLLMALLRSYALFLLYVVLGPFMIMMGVLPGSKINFENWFRHLLGYSMGFPTAIAILLLSRVITNAFGNTTTGFVPPLIGGGQISSQAVGALIGFAILMLVPQSVTMMQDLFAAPDIKYLPGVLQGIAAGGGLVTNSFTKALWDPLFREQNIATGQQAGIVRNFFLQGVNQSTSPGPLRFLARWFGYRTDANGGQGGGN